MKGIFDINSNSQFTSYYMDHIFEENEIKLKIEDVSGMLARLRELTKYSHTEYLRDVIYGIKNEKKKIRLRLSDNFEHTCVEATHKYKTAADDGDVKKEIEEIIYKGSRLDDALAMIRLQGDFEEENSYEKMRVVFNDEMDTIVTVDIYPFGCWLEIEGSIDCIHALAKKLGFTIKDYIKEGADDLYLKWIKEQNLPEMWDVCFGLTGKK